MSETLQAMVEAMAKEIGRQAQDRELYVPPDGVMYNGRVAIVDGPVDLEKVARAALAAIPAEALAAAFAAAIDSSDYYVWGTTDGPDVVREDFTAMGIDGTGDMVATMARAMEILARGVAWKPHAATGVLIASA